MAQIRKKRNGPVRMLSPVELANEVGIPHSRLTEWVRLGLLAGPGSPGHGVSMGG